MRVSLVCERFCDSRLGLRSIGRDRRTAEPRPYEGTPSCSVRKCSTKLPLGGTSSTFPQHSPGFQRFHRPGRAGGANTDVQRGSYETRRNGGSPMSIVTILIIIILVLVVLYLLRRVF